MSGLLRMGYLLLLLNCSLLLADGGQTADEPALLPYRLLYKASYNGLPITAVYSLEHTSDDRYILSSSAKNWLGKIEETGVFTLDQDGRILNQRYQYERRILGSKKMESLTFDHQQGKAFYKAPKKERTFNFTLPIHSRFSYQLQLRRDLINGAEILSYPVLTRGKKKEYRFQVVGEEVLETSLGPVNTVRVARLRDNDERETVLWLAKDWHYILVQLWQREEDGEDYQITLKEGSLGDHPLPLSATVAKLKILEK